MNDIATMTPKDDYATVTAPQTVRLPGGLRVFPAGERIHTENSYKYTPPEFTALLREAGFRSIRCWQDARRDFAVYYAA